MKESEINKIIRIAHDVNQELGTGFLEKVYQNALSLALMQEGFETGREVPLKVMFRNKAVGEYFADLLVNQKLLIELKACSSLKPEHSAQVINYLKAGPVKMGLLINFAQKTAQIKRFYG